MVEPLPKWEMKNYALLWSKFRKKTFTNKEAQKLLKLKNTHLLSVLFYDLKKTDWLEIKRDPKDQRKKIYKLKEPNKAVGEMAK